MTTEAIPAVIGDKIRCDACPVMCYIKPGAAGACDRYANHDGQLVRVDPHIVLERTVEHGGRLGVRPQSANPRAVIGQRHSTFSLRIPTNQS